MSLKIKVWKSLFVYVWVRKTLTPIIKIFLDWLKSNFGVVLLCFGFDWQISGKKGNLPISGKFGTLHLGVGALT